MSQFQPRQNDPPRDACHPPTIQQPAMSEVPSQYPDVTPGFATNATAPRLGLEYIPPSQRSVVLDSPFISEPRADSPADDDEYRSAPTPIPTPAADSAGATPIAERSNVRFPRQVSVQPPERQGTAKPRDYQPRRRAYGEGSSGHDQKLADMGSIRMGTSALISALSALPLETENTSSDEADDEGGAETMRQSEVLPPQRPKMSRMQSSLQTLRPMAPPPEHAEHSDSRSSISTGTDSSHSPGHSPPTSPSRRHGRRKLSFPYKENVITRRARGPSTTELEYQLAPKSPDRGFPPLRVESSSTLKQIAADVVDADNVEDINESALGMPEKGHLAVEAPESTPQMLQRVFGLEEEEELIEEMHCWLLRSDMLQGYMYLTRRHICFFAKVAPVEDDKIKSGPLWKKASRTKLSTRYWVTLRNDVLSWFESADDPYFPKGNVSLQYALTCELVDDTRFKVRLPERNYTFQSDTPGNAQEWVRVIQKTILKIQHEGQGVKIIIPWEAVYEVERSPTLEFQETIEVKVIDAEDSMSLDSYFFASFPDNDYAYDLLQNLLRERPVSELPPVAPPSPKEPERKRDSARFSFSGLSSALPTKFGGNKGDAKAPVPIDPPTRLNLPDSSYDSVASHSEADSEMSEDDEATRRRKGYPPKQTGPPPPGMVATPSGWAPTDWIRRGSKQLFGSSPGSDSRLPPRRRPRRQSSVTEVVEGYPSTTTDDEASESDLPRRRRSARASFTKLASSMSDPSYPYVQEDSVAIKFRKTFALPEKEILVDHMSGSLYRVLPVSGRFFVSTNYFCFRSSGLLNKTKMIVPIRQLYGMKAQKAFRFGHHALIVIIKGHEELFLEFHSARRRDELMMLLEERMDDIREVAQATKAVQYTVPGALRPFTDDMGGSGHDEPSTGPGLMFNSTTSSFLQFKPEPMTIVCLTIGSRGDVQPYIALCKGLQAEGHTCRIATHAEYQKWVEGHGIGFAPVGGDPAKLMELCVDNGMFTIAFLKEGLQMFRGWLDDLLNDSWTACQGADLLIESPSAMAGIHIAEALRIPYYRAFTMPWTRTRAYPQAFAVPEHKRGGSYNYMTYVMFDNVFWRAISGQVNSWRKNVLGIDSTTFDKMQQDKVPFLYNFSPSVVPPPLDWTEWIHVTGYWFLDNADGNKDWQPPVGIVEFIDNAHALGKKVVYIGFGSIVVSDPHEMTRCVVQGVVDSGVCAILSKGWSDRGSRGKNDHPELEAVSSHGADGVEFPPEIFSVDAIDHTWLFPRIDAACHHGGAGTTGASLRAGIPTIIKPFFGDQYFWAERVESLGVGSGLRQLTYDGLATALIEATTNERQIAKAKVVGQAIREEEGVQRAIEALYRDLEYAKSIIKPPAGEARKASRSSLSLSQSHSRSASGTHSRTSSSGLHSLLPSHSHSRTRSMDQEARSDESWSVVSDSGAASHISSPSHDHVDAGERSDSSDDEHRHRHHIPVISNLVSHLIPHLHGESPKSHSPKGGSPKPPRSPKL